MKRAVLLIASLLLALWIGSKMFPSNDQQIRSNLNTLSKTLSVTPNDNTIKRAFKSERAGGFFASEIAIEVEGPRDRLPEISTRTDLQHHLLELYGAMNELDVQFLDLLVKVAPDKQSATALTTALVTFKGEKQPYAQELKITFQKDQGHWLIHRVQAIETIQ